MIQDDYPENQLGETETEVRIDQDIGEDLNIRESEDPLGNTIGDPRPRRRAVVQKPYSGVRFLITLNEPDRWPHLYRYLVDRGSVHYLVAAEEKAPTTGHKHIHCYVHYRISKKLYPNKLEGAHVDKCRGSPYQNMEYVKKDGKIIIEEGKAPVQGKKKWTIGDCREASDEEISEQGVAFYSQIKKIRADWDLKKRQGHATYNPTPKITWIYGPTGTGKTRYVVERGATAIQFSSQGYFSDWGDARIIAFEEMRGQIPFPLLLQIGDFYNNHYVVNIKGGFKIVDIDELIITSPMSPKDCYPNLDNDGIGQLLRRIKEVRCTAVNDNHVTEDLNA